MSVFLLQFGSNSVPLGSQKIKLYVAASLRTTRRDTIRIWNRARLLKTTVIKRYIDYIENKWRNANFLYKVVIFILAPQIVASIVTGFSLKEIWEQRKDPELQLKEHFIKNITLWILAVAWFWGFWLVVFPFGVFLLITLAT